MKRTLLALCLPFSAMAKPKVACTLPILESLAKEVGGDRIEVFSLASGYQDPHFVSPTPSLMNRVRKADLLVEVGMQLELWVDDVANGSGNPRIFRGAAGRIAVSGGIPKMEVPSVVSRSQGDIHPEGNPHVWLDPMRMKQLAENLARELGRRFPGDAAYFEQRKIEFQKRIDSAFFGAQLVDLVGSKKLTRLTLDGRLHEFLDTTEVDGTSLGEKAGGWLKRAAVLHGQSVVEFHRVWAYFAQSFGLNIVGTVEEKPGIPPGPRHLDALAQTIHRLRVRLVLVDNYYDPGAAQRVASQGGARVVLLPNQVGGEKGITNYFQLIDFILDRLLSI